LPSGEGIPRQHAHSIARARAPEGYFEVEAIAAEHAAERFPLGLADHLALCIEGLDQQAYICHTASTIVVDIARIVCQAAGDHDVITVWGNVSVTRSDDYCVGIVSYEEVSELHVNQSSNGKNGNLNCLLDDEIFLTVSVGNNESGDVSCH
jgi:hypothetical protein